MRSPRLFRPEDSALLVVDVQEKLAPLMPAPSQLIDRLALLIDGAKLLEVPTLVTEQYPAGLGSTVPPLAGRLEDAVEKRQFSAAVDAILEPLRQSNIRNVVVCGVETHICVLQTVYDLLANGFRVQVTVDAVASRGLLDHQTAMRRFEQAGATLSTVESILFEWMQSSEHPQFRAVSRLVKEATPSTNQ